MTINFQKEDRIISEFLRSLGPWKDQITVGGGYALIIYKPYLTDNLKGPAPVGTRDLDSLIQRKLIKASSNDIAEHLINAGFSRFCKDLQNPATEAYIREIQGVEVEIEFLTNAGRSKEKNVTVAGVTDQPLAYLEQSLSHKMNFRTYSGEEGKVVEPAAWIFHKGLTFPRRKEKLKIFKDLYGIWYTVTQLQNLSEKALSDLKILAEQAPKWFNTFQKNLNSWVINASPNDWMKLETQDPSGNLKKLHFERFITNITSFKKC